METSTEEVNRLFGKAVREYRVQAGLSQEELADVAGLHRTYVSLLERGQRNPSLQVVLTLARALGVAGATLVAEIENKVS